MNGDNEDVIGGGSGAPPSEAKTGCDGLVAEAQVPRGVFSFCLSSSTPPLKGDLQVDLSRGLQGEINSSNPFYLKKQVTAKIFFNKWCKIFFSNLKTSKIQCACKFMFFSGANFSSFSFVPSTCFTGTEWQLLTSPSTPGNRIKGVVKNCKIHYSETAKKIQLKIDIRNENRPIKEFIPSNSEFSLRFLAKTNVLLKNEEVMIETIMINLICFFLLKGTAGTPKADTGRRRSKYTPPKVPEDITDPKLKVKFLDDHRRAWEKEERENNKRKREENLRRLEEIKKQRASGVNDNMSTAMKIKLDEERKEAEKIAQEESDKRLAAQIAAKEKKAQEEADRKLAEYQAQVEAEKKKKEEEKLLKEEEEKKRQEETEQRIKALREAVDDGDQSSDIGSDEVDSEYEKEIEERKERQNLQKRVKPKYGQVCKEGIIICVRHPKKNTELDNKDFAALETGITKFLDAADRAGKDVGINNGGGMISGMSWYPVRNQQTKELFEREIPKISPPEGRSYTYVVGEDEDRPKLYSCYVRENLWEPRDILEERLRRYTPLVNFTVTEDDGTVRPAYVKIKVGGVDKKNEVRNDGFIVKLELENRIVDKLIDGAEPGMEGRVKFGAVSSTELQGNGVEARAKAKQEAILQEAQKRKERREKIREKRRQKFLARHKTHPH